MHMLRRWLGDDDFRAGLKIYFEKHQYSNTIGHDLWDALSEASGKDVAAFMDAWLEQPGYPVVTAEVVDDTLVLSQKQFFIGEGQDQNRIWPIPLNTNWTGLPETLTEERLAIPNFSQLAAQNEGALRLNTANTAHYITNYKGQLLKAVLNQLTELDTTSKLQVVQERRLLAESGEISYAELIPLLTKLTDETSYLVSEAIAQVVDGLDMFMDEGSEAQAEFKALVNRLMQKNYDRLGFEPQVGESDEDEMVRQKAISLMLYADNADAVAKAEEIFDAHKENIESIPASIRLSVLANQVKHAETEELVSLYLDCYVKINDGNFRRQLAAALSNTKEKATVERILGELKNKDVVKPQDLAMSWYRPFLNKDFSQGAFWNWACENWDWITSALGGDMSFDKFVIYPANTFKTPERLEEYKAFFEPQLDDMAISRNITMGIKEISARINLINTSKAAVESALAEL